MATLEEVIPDAKKRKPVYQVFAAIGLILTATQVGFASADAAQPVALTVALAVYAFLGGAGFVLAAGNTARIPQDYPDTVEYFTDESHQALTDEFEYTPKHADV